MRLAFFLILIVALVHSEFIIEKVDVLINDISEDGSAHVHESIKMLIYGENSKLIYDTGLTSNDLAFWSNITNLRQIKAHVNPSLIGINDLRVRPQPRTKCNPIQGVCHGELILDYIASPILNENNSVIKGSGLFNITKYKPRTRRYSINPNVLSFVSTPENNTIIGSYESLTIALPENNLVYDVNPAPADFESNFPIYLSTLSWSDVILVKFSLIFDVEEGIDKEVTDFLSSIVVGFLSLTKTQNGIALIFLIGILLGFFIYINVSKKRGE